MYLHNNKEQFFNVLESVSKVSKIQADLVEKDYYVSLILKEIATSSNKVVFKGGTSLSKALKAINRFSEDIDISFSEHIGASRYFRVSTLTNNSENFCKKFVKYGVHWIFALRQNPEST